MEVIACGNSLSESESLWVIKKKKKKPHSLGGFFLAWYFQVGLHTFMD